MNVTLRKWKQIMKHIATEELKLETLIILFLLPPPKRTGKHGDRAKYVTTPGLAERKCTGRSGGGPSFQRQAIRAGKPS